jgi:hypothetical protein
MYRELLTVQWSQVSKRITFRLNSAGRTEHQRRQAKRLMMVMICP